MSLDGQGRKVSFAERVHLNQQHGRSIPFSMGKVLTTVDIVHLPPPV